MTSNKKLARIAGLLYLIVIATGLFAEIFVRQTLRVSNDAIATAHKIQTSEILYRLGIAADLTNFVIGLPCVLIVYLLFQAVNKHLLRLALTFVIIQTAIIAVNLLNQISTLLFLTNDAYMTSFQPGQLATLALHALDLQAHGYGIGLVFFGFYCLVVGYVIFKSGLIPRVIGILYSVSGLCYLLNSFTLILFPKMSGILFPYFAFPAFLGEISFCLWLLIMGIKENNSTAKNTLSMLGQENNASSSAALQV
jgi:hypothetical protein